MGSTCKADLVRHKPDGSSYFVSSLINPTARTFFLVSFTPKP